MARFDAVCADVAAPSLVFQLLTDGKRLPEIAKEWRIPKGRFIEWFTTKHEDLYDAALKVRAAELAMDALDASLAATPEDVAVQKLRADVALKLAAKFDRARYGETVKVERDLRLVADAGLLGTMGEILKLATARKPLVLEHAKAAVVDAELI